MQTSTVVRMSRQDHDQWFVWLEGKTVGQFSMLTDALDFVRILECSPRARAEALAA